MGAKLTLRPSDLYCARASTMGFISRFLFVLILVAAALADAGDTPKIVVVPFTPSEGASDTATGRFTGQVTEELRGRDDAVELVGSPVVSKPAASSGKSTRPSPEAT